jgi:hypothetical protein
MVVEVDHFHVPNRLIIYERTNEWNPSHISAFHMQIIMRIRRLNSHNLLYKYCSILQLPLAKPREIKSITIGTIRFIGQ